jgi:subtilisin family serine protease
VGTDFSGDSGGFYVRQEETIAAADGRTDVIPTFRFGSDASGTGDGGYVENFNVLCRGHSYTNLIRGEGAADGGSYTAIAGTSMAAPHAAGAAALVRAVDPGAPPEQVVEALRQGARPDFGMQGVTVTGGVVDASGAMDAALAIPNTQPPPPPPPPPAATPPSRPRFGKARVNRRGVVSVVVRSDPATTGVLTLSANITAARVRRVGRKAFRVGAGRRATVRVRLGRRARRQLGRRHVLRLRMRAVVRNGAGLSSSRTARIRIRQPRKR